ncbi:MAG: flavodoxin [Anaerococcus sp.]|nr:flavodoxin [Anaerococcus sp.]
MQINIIYWSGTGNTQAMAEAIAQGLEESNASYKIIPVEEASIEDVKQADKLAFGCSAQGAEELEDTTMRPFMDEANELIENKEVLLFGSYEWADGEWMETWVEEVKETGAKLIREEGVIAYDSPDEEKLEELKQIGQEMSK